MGLTCVKFHSFSGYHSIMLAEYISYMLRSSHFQVSWGTRKIIGTMGRQIAPFFLIDVVLPYIHGLENTRRLKDDNR